MSQVADQKKAMAKNSGSSVIPRTKNVILQTNGRFHEWSDACKARIIASKPRWVTLWDIPRSEPKPSPIAEILAELQGETINPYEDHPTPANGVGTRGRGRQPTVSSSSSTSAAVTAAQQETAAVAFEEDPLSKEAAKMFRDDLSKIKTHREEVFADLWGHLSRDVQSNIEMHRHLRAIRDKAGCS